MEFGILYAIQNLHTEFLDLVMVTASKIGNVGMVWIVTAVIMMFAEKTRRCGFLMLVSMAVCLAAGNGLLKNLIARPRPCWIDTSVPLLIANPTDYSFPSGHTMHGFTAAVTVYLHDRRRGILLLCLAALIAFSRLYLFVHFPSDILGGAVIGTAVALLVNYSGRPSPQ